MKTQHLALLCSFVLSGFAQTGPSSRFQTYYFQNSTSITAASHTTPALTSLDTIAPKTSTTPFLTTNNATSSTTDDTQTFAAASTLVESVLPSNVSSLVTTSSQDFSSSIQTQDIISITNNTGAAVSTSDYSEAVATLNITPDTATSTTSANTNGTVVIATTTNSAGSAATTSEDFFATTYSDYASLSSTVTIETSITDSSGEATAVPVVIGPGGIGYDAGSDSSNSAIAPPLIVPVVGGGGSSGGSSTSGSSSGSESDSDSGDGSSSSTLNSGDDSSGDSDSDSSSSSSSDDNSGDSTGDDTGDNSGLNPSGDSGSSNENGDTSSSTSSSDSGDSSTSDSNGDSGSNDSSDSNGDSDSNSSDDSGDNSTSDSDSNSDTGDSNDSDTSDPEDSETYAESICPTTTATTKRSLLKREDILVASNVMKVAMGLFGADKKGNSYATSAFSSTTDLLTNKFPKNAANEWVTGLAGKWTTPAKLKIQGQVFDKGTQIPWRFRWDFDPVKGPHINFELVKKGANVKVAVQLDKSQWVDGDIDGSRTMEGIMDNMNAKAGGYSRDNKGKSADEVEWPGGPDAVKSNIQDYFKSEAASSC